MIKIKFEFIIGSIVINIFYLKKGSLWANFGQICMPKLFSVTKDSIIMYILLIVCVIEIGTFERKKSRLQTVRCKLRLFAINRLRLNNEIQILESFWKQICSFKSLLDLSMV